MVSGSKRTGTVHERSSRIGGLFRRASATLTISSGGKKWKMLAQQSKKLILIERMSFPAHGPTAKFP